MRTPQVALGISQPVLRHFPPFSRDLVSSRGPEFCLAGPALTRAPLPRPLCSTAVLRGGRSSPLPETCWSTAESSPSPLLLLFFKSQRAKFRCKPHPLLSGTVSTFPRRPIQACWMLMLLRLAPIPLLHSANSFTSRTA